jgi:hypothetical protein
MSETPEVTAQLLNRILLSMDLMIDGKDDLFSLQEFSLGLPELNRSIDLCYGYAKVPATTSALADYEVVIGKGLSRITNGSVTAKLTRVNTDFTGLNITSLLPASKKYENVYAFANIFLAQTTPGLIDNPTSTLSLSILKGDSSGPPLFMSKEISISDLILMSRKGEIPDAAAPVNPSIKLFNIIIEINYYDPDDVATKDVVFHFIDKRKPRGWGGFAEEFMGVYLTPYLINKNIDFDEFYNEFDQKFYNLVRNWMNLRFWSPSFLDFWADPANNALMPDRLKEYLELKFSIII